MRQEIYTIVTEAVHHTNKLLENKVPVEQGEQCLLFGGAGLLDSLSLVSLVVAIEEAIEKKYNTPLILADEKAMFQKRSPFASIGSLTDYVKLLMKEVSCE
jgi:D-alanine--poly(phosphoribitol) ligase subunit 2